LQPEVQIRLPLRACVRPPPGWLSTLQTCRVCLWPVLLRYPPPVPSHLTPLASRPLRVQC
jgi:hypothetical protein